MSALYFARHEDEFLTVFALLKDEAWNIWKYIQMFPDWVYKEINNNNNNNNSNNNNNNNKHSLRSNTKGYGVKTH
jgi:hypothetical protein